MCASKTEVTTLPAYRTTIVFIGYDSLISVHCFYSSFVTGVMWWTHVTSKMANGHKNSTWLCWNISKNLIETWRHCVSSIVRKRGSHLHTALIFFGNMRLTYSTFGIGYQEVENYLTHNSKTQRDIPFCMFVWLDRKGTMI